MDSPTFRDVTILYAQKDQIWCDYVLNHFRNDQLKMRLETLSVDESDYENPPEIEVAVRESHVLVLLTTSYLLSYMEEKKDWFSPMLQKRDPEVSVTIYTTLDFKSDEMEEFCEEHSYSFEASNCMEIMVNGSNITQVIANIIQLVEVYANKKAKRDAPPRRLSERDLPVQIVPDCLHKPGEKVALLFQQEIKGEVIVNFRHVKEDIHCELVNPFCAIFDAPDVTGSRVSMQINIDGMRHSRHKLPNKVKSCQFSSVELLCQTYGASSREELDKMLASKLSQSLCSDPLAMRIFDRPPDKPGSFETNDDLYPTMLHWAAAHGLSELSSALLSAPGAALACDVNNVDGDDPIDLARKKGYPELSDLIDEFIETQELADTCDLYVQSFSVFEFPEEVGGEYEQVNAFAPDELGHEGVYAPMSSPGVGKPLSQPGAPPLPPPRKGSSGSNIQSPAALPSPKDFLALPTPVLAMGAVGSRSQTELVEIQEEVKKGNFSIKEAEMLFRSWKERYQTGAAVSFRDRQQGLKAFKQEHMRAMEALKKVNQHGKKNKKDNYSSTVNISEPILKRQNFGSSKRVAGSGRGDSTNSNISCQSTDSGRASTLSNISHASSSSEDMEYVYPTDSPQSEAPALRSQSESGTPARNCSQSKANRISYRDLYLTITEEEEAKERESSPPPPPVPPRPSLLTGSAKPKPTAKPKVYSRRGSNR